ncbi:MAG: hypothetical protein KatS3mg111_2599 [Pirellulaceae bacterium]|nr:MAG: hypothetical protein KatS3mg111_2599 [Pirellulaceae bacterium]
MGQLSGRWALAALCFFGCTTRLPADVPLVGGVERQPFESMVARLVQALELAGSPVSPVERQKMEALRNEVRDAVVVKQLQELLDAYCLVVVHINPESRVKVLPGPARPLLDEKGWTNFLVKVINEAGVTSPLICRSPQAAPMVRPSTAAARPALDITPAESARRWLEIAMYARPPLRSTLSGLECEYRILQLYSRDAGKREAILEMHVGQGTQDLGFRSELPILFDCRPSVEVPLVIRDEDGIPTTCSLLIKDAHGRVYPNPSRRLAPDFFFHEQIYRRDGESLRLAPGRYQVTAYRGPEYLPTRLELEVDRQSPPAPLDISLRRWIHMAEYGWFSGDHHVHAAGCAHYENPSEGVTPEDMVRHIVGEDLNVGCVLSWGPCWYYQKQFFDGKVSQLSRPGYLMRYDVEVSGFPSSHAGHLCLLNLQEDDYPGTKSIDEWPSWTLPVLRWGREQGGVVGYSHSGWGLALPDYLPDGSRGRYPRTWGGSDAPSGRAADRLPDYAMPPFDGIGANEYIVTGILGQCDFISAVDTPAIWELNIWYHTLNCGVTTRLSGETDFPCIYGERVGLGRSYVHLPGTQKADLQYEDWIRGIREGRSYVTDGMSHLLQFRVGERELGEIDEQGHASRLDLAAPDSVLVRCTVAALLPEQQDARGAQIAQSRLDVKPYWHLERARIGSSRRVPVELVVNGEAVARREITADGEPKEVMFDVPIAQSSWLAVRILPSMHSNPIFVHVAGAPIWTNANSARWCRDAVDVCWQQKRTRIRPEELEEAKAAYDQARRRYQEILDTLESLQEGAKQ